jgi:hypothetical protein
MAHPQTHSGHLLSVALLLTAAAVALTAERISAAPAGPVARRIPSVGDLGAFVSAAAQDSLARETAVVSLSEPFGGSDEYSSVSVASQSGSPTVSSGRTRQLTAILVADNRPVAVIDDEVVSVGDVLRDGARVARIQSERVFVVEKSGKWRTLTLAKP